MGYTRYLSDSAYKTVKTKTVVGLGISIGSSSQNIKNHVFGWAYQMGSAYKFIKTIGCWVGNIYRGSAYKDVKNRLLEWVYILLSGLEHSNYEKSLAGCGRVYMGFS